MYNSVRSILFKIAVFFVRLCKLGCFYDAHIQVMTHFVVVGNLALGVIYENILALLVAQWLCDFHHLAVCSLEIVVEVYIGVV